MRRKFPSQVFLEPNEIYRVNRIRIAQFYGIKPQSVDEMPASDVEDTLEVMWADNQK